MTAPATRTVDVGGEPLSFIMNGKGAIFIGLEELAEPIALGRPVFFCHDPKSLAVLRGWDLPAAACIGLFGADDALGERGDGDVVPELETLRGADVVIVLDGEPAWRNIAGLLAWELQTIAKQVRMPDLAFEWADSPDRFSVVEWAAAGGSLDRLNALMMEFAAEGKGRVDLNGDAHEINLPEPDSGILGEQIRSKFGTKFWHEIGVGKVRYDWVVKKIIPAKQIVLSFGDSGTGKSFDTLDMTMAVSRGIEFAGQKVMQGAAIYIAGEAQTGFQKRVKAYREHHGIDDTEEKIEFALVTRKPALFKNEEEVGALIEELKWIKRQFTQPLRLIVVDTFSAVAKGMNENQSEDVSLMRDVFDRIRDELDCAVLIVHHKPKGGSTPRGHSSLTADFETTIEYANEEQRAAGGMRLHTATVRKQREEEPGFNWKFILPQKVLGYDDDGDKITSCVKEPWGLRDDDAPKGPKLNSDRQRAIYRALKFLIDDRGIAPPPQVQGAPKDAICITNHELRDYVRSKAKSVDQTGDQLANTVRKQCARALERFAELRLIDVWTEPGAAESGAAVTSWIWLTTRRPAGYRPPAAGEKEPEDPEVPV